MLTLQTRQVRSIMKSLNMHTVMNLRIHTEFH